MDRDHQGLEGVRNPVTSDLHHQAEIIFNEAIERPDAMRAIYLDEACREDAELVAGMVAAGFDESLQGELIARAESGEVSEEIFADGVCLPSGSSLTDEQRERVVAAIVDAHEQR